VFEKPPKTGLDPSPEPGPERIPTEIEIKEHFDRLLEGREYIDRRKLEDEQGIYLWEVTTILTPEECATIEESEGTKEYTYTRKGPHAAGNPIQTTINFSYYDAAGMPVGGGSAAQLINGTWKFFE